MPTAPHVVPQRWDPAVPVTALTPHPDNARLGDLDLIAESLDTVGFYTAVYAQASTGRVIAGWNRLQAAIGEGADTVPVMWLDVDDDAARRIMLVDNRASDVGRMDEDRLTRLLLDADQTDAGLTGTGYTPGDLAGMLLAREGRPFQPPAPQGSPSSPEADTRSLVLVYGDRADLSALLDALDVLLAAWGAESHAQVVVRLVLDADAAAGG